MHGKEIPCTYGVRTLMVYGQILKQDFKDYLFLYRFFVLALFLVR